MSCKYKVKIILTYVFQTQKILLLFYNGFEHGQSTTLQASYNLYLSFL